MTKGLILEKIEALIRKRSTTEEEAFAFFDENSDGKLSKEEIKNLLKEAEVNGFIRGIVADRLIDAYDTDNDGHVNWSEFKMAVNKL